MKFCQLHLSWLGAPPAHAGQDEPIRSPSQTPLLSLPAAGGRLWGFLTLGFATYSFMYQREIPSPFCSSSTRLFIKASTRFFSGGCSCTAMEEKGHICHCRTERERFFFHLLLEGMFQFTPRLPPPQPVPTAFLTHVQWAPLGRSVGQVQLQFTDIIICQIYSELIIHLACRKYGCSFEKIIILIILQHNSIYTSDNSITHFKVNCKINMLM